MNISQYWRMASKFFIFANYIALVVSSSLVDDYVNLINNEVAKSKTYQLPKNHTELFRSVKNKNSLADDFGTFDFIVVGAGSSGAIVAKRLSESKFTVLLLEAGVEESNFTIIPGIAKILKKSKYNWGYFSVAQDQICQAMINHQCPAVCGKSLGGSSAVNFMVYSRPNRFDHNSWSTFGITGWTWRDVLPYYKKFENYQSIGLERDLHGFSGPINIDYSRPSSYLVDIFLQANKEIDKITVDYNGDDFLGTGKSQFNKLKGYRASTASCYLSNITEQYLNISKSSFVYKILIDEKNAAYGVEFLKNNKRFVAFSNHEVIISGGAYNTPQLLLLSGIGPKNDLAKHNIPLKNDLPVGLFMEDHVMFFGLRFESNFTISQGNTSLEQIVWELLDNNEGPLTDSGLQAVSFISTDEANLLTPDIELLLSPYEDSPFSLENESNLRPEYLVDFSKSHTNLNNIYRLIIMLLQPKSQGTIKLASKNAEIFPLIDPKSLTVTEDIERIYKAIEYALKLLDTEAFKKINARLVEEVLPGCLGVDYLSKEYWYCAIKHFSTNYHATGTCSMGNDTKKSVVNSDLRVHGIRNLRVVDLSVVPISPAAHTNALAMMIGEKAADIIKADFSVSTGYKEVPTGIFLFFMLVTCVSTII